MLADEPCVNPTRNVPVTAARSSWATICSKSEAPHARSGCTMEVVLAEPGSKIPPEELHLT